MSTQRANFPRKKRHTKGFALVFVLAFAAIVAVFTAAAGAQASYNLHLASGRGQTDRAYYAANTGTQLILSLLREPPVDFDYNQDGVEGPWLEEDASVYIPMVSSDAEAFAHVYHNIKGLGHAEPVAPDGTKIPPESFYIISLGNLDGIPNDGIATPGGVQYNQATMGSTMRPNYPIMPQAAFAFDELIINGAIVDHFDSQASSAPWVASNDSTSGPGSPDPKKFPEASVATNTPSAMSITISNSSTKIYGHVLLGTDATATDLTDLGQRIRQGTAVAPAGSWPPTTPNVNQFGRAGTDDSGDTTVPVTGRIDKLPGPKTVPVMEFDPADVISVSSLPTSLVEGKIYHVSGNLTLSSSDSVQVVDAGALDGKIEDVIVLVDNDITFSYGSRVNMHRPSRQLKFYSLSGGTFTVESGSKNNYCLVAGRELSVVMKNGAELWGAVLGKKISLESGSKLHFDVQLRNPIAVADLYGFELANSVVTPGSSVTAEDLGPSGPPATTGGTSGGGTSGTGTSGTTTTTGGGGCGCGGGSMLMAEQMK